MCRAVGVQVLEAHTLTVLQLRPSRLVLTGDPCQVREAAGTDMAGSGSL